MGITTEVYEDIAQVMAAYVRSSIRRSDDIPARRPMRAPAVRVIKQTDLPKRPSGSGPGHRGCRVALLVYSGRITLPFMGFSAAASLKSSLNSQMKSTGDDRRADAVTCSQSDALDYLQGAVTIRNGVRFERAYSCDVTWSDGTTAEFCQVKLSSSPTMGLIGASCEAAGRRGWGRSTFRG